MKTIVLEPSTNTHTLSANKVKATTLENGVMQIDVTGKGIVTHGEHGTLVTESKRVYKYVQQELNPITKAMQNAFD
jgi:hypothetical protein